MARNFHGMASEMLYNNQPILFYDGDCPLCNRVVSFILNNEKSPIIFFSAQQDAPTQIWLATHPDFLINEDTVYYYDGKSFYKKSTAVLRLIPSLKFYWSFLYLGWFIPKFIRDWIYDGVAKRRKKLFRECRYDPRLKNRTLK
jgi:predicted DCC family thiol-disulfide oxidoreductase YuxK